MIALVVVGGLLSSPAQTSVALADEQAEVSTASPISAIQDAVRGDDVSRGADRSALEASQVSASATTQRRLATLERQRRAIAAQQAALKKKAEAARKKKLAKEKARKARIAKLGYEPG